jgi:hypothetical protein
MAQKEGDRTPEMRRDRERLTVRSPRIETALASLCIDDDNIEEARRFGNKLQADADRWLQRGGFAERGRIYKSDAYRLFAHAFGGSRT